MIPIFMIIKLIDEKGVEITDDSNELEVSSNDWSVTFFCTKSILLSIKIKSFQNSDETYEKFEKLS